MIRRYFVSNPKKTGVKQFNTYIDRPRRRIFLNWPDSHASVLPTESPCHVDVIGVCALNGDVIIRGSASEPGVHMYVFIFCFKSESFLNLVLNDPLFEKSKK